MAGTIMPSPWFTGLDDNGVTVIGGKLYTYAAGTSTPLTTYSDVDLQVPNSNPIILDGGGRAIVYLPPASFKFVLKDEHDVTIKSQDNIVATAPFGADLDMVGVAGDTLSPGSVVYLSSGAGGTINGRWYLADADVDASSSTASFVAIALATTLAGAIGTFRVQGRVSVPGPLIVNAPYYVSTVAGGLVTPAPVAPAFTRVVGIAQSPTTLVIATGFGTGTVITGDASIGGNLSVTGETTLFSDLIFTGNSSIRRNTLDGADTGTLVFGGGGGPFVAGGPRESRGALVQVFGNESATAPGVLALVAGTTGTLQFWTGNPAALRGTMHQSGGFSWGDAIDPGSQHLRVAGNITTTGAEIIFSVLSGASGIIRTDAPFGSNDRAIRIGAGGDGSTGSGAVIALSGNNASGDEGSLILAGGAVPTGQIIFAPGGLSHGIMHGSGGFSWGTIADPGDQNLAVAGTLSAGSATTTTLTVAGSVMTGNEIVFTGLTAIIRTDAVPGSNERHLRIGSSASATTSDGAVIDLIGNDLLGSQGWLILAGGAPFGRILLAPGGLTAGTLFPSGGFSWGNTVDPGATNLSVTGAVSAAAYNTVSDATLKDDRGVVTETTVLAGLRVHDYDWKVDGSRGRGLFAQEAITVAPAAVTVGDGATPWQMDYSKLVPDLIAGWQSHERRILALLDRLVELESRHDG